MAGGNIKKAVSIKAKNRFSQHGVLVTTKLWGTDLRFTKTEPLNTLLYFCLNDIIKIQKRF